jgi:hypothetical protein
MSYCRFSSDNWQCDVYCYQAQAGYAVSVAARRRLFASPLPEPPHAHPTTEAEWQEYGRWQVELHSLASIATLVDIGLPCDGAHYLFATAQEAADKLTELRGMGYRVPQSAIDTLREEAQSNGNV